MPKTEFDTDDAKSPSTPEPSLHSGSTSATSVSLDDDDVFDTSENHQHIADGSQNSAPREDILSDLPAMQRQHMTAGYREGLSDSKAKHMQGGFDRGYPIGFELGIKVGKIFGVLEGFLAAFAQDQKSTPAGLVELYNRAAKELAISQLLDGLDDKVLASTEFEFKELPMKSRELLGKWEVLVVEMMREKT